MLSLLSATAALHAREVLEAKKIYLDNKKNANLYQLPNEVLLVRLLICTSPLVVYSELVAEHCYEIKAGRFSIGSKGFPSSVFCLPER